MVLNTQDLVIPLGVIYPQSMPSLGKMRQELNHKSEFHYFIYVSYRS